MKAILTSDLHYGCAPTNANTLEKFFKTVRTAIETEGVDLLILAGDLASHKQRHFRNLLTLAKKYVDKIPIVVVRGNHDFWDDADDKDKDAGFRSYASINQAQIDFMKKVGVHHLEDGPLLIKDVLICGFDGWYNHVDPPTNDKYRMPQMHEGVSLMTYLSNRAWKMFDECLKLDTEGCRASVIVTHFNPYIFGKGYRSYVPDPKIDAAMSANPKFLDEMRGKFDVLCCGHTHAYKDEVDTKGNKPLRILNAGSDYNVPKYILFYV